MGYDFKVAFDALINEAISNNVQNSELIQVLSGKLAALNAVESEPAPTQEQSPEAQQGEGASGSVGGEEQSSAAPASTTEQQAA